MKFESLDITNTEDAARITNTAAETKIFLLSFLRSLIISFSYDSVSLNTGCAGFSSSILDNISSILISSFILLAVLTFSITCLDAVTVVFTSLLIISDFFSFSAKTVSLILRFDLSIAGLMCWNDFSSLLISEFAFSSLFIGGLTAGLTSSLFTVCGDLISTGFSIFAAASFIF